MNTHKSGFAMRQIMEQIFIAAIIINYNLHSKFRSLNCGGAGPMHRCCFCLAALISITTLPAAAFADSAAAPMTTHRADTANAGGFYIDLPAVNYRRLIGLIRTYQNSLTHREDAMTKYLDEHQLDATDALITAILPGGLLYALIRKGNLEQVKAELADISEEIDELAHDLLAMQAEAGELTVAQLQ
jgi:hypothetical protein